MSHRGGRQRLRAGTRGDTSLVFRKIAHVLQMERSLGSTGQSFPLKTSVPAKLIAPAFPKGIRQRRARIF